MTPRNGGTYRPPVRANERYDDDVGGGFVEPHWRDDPLADWEQPAPDPVECRRERTR